MLKAIKLLKMIFDSYLFYKPFEMPQKKRPDASAHTQIKHKSILLYFFSFGPMWAEYVLGAWYWSWFGVKVWARVWVSRPTESVETICMSFCNIDLSVADINNLSILHLWDVLMPRTIWKWLEWHEERIRLKKIEKYTMVVQWKGKLLFDIQINCVVVTKWRLLSLSQHSKPEQNHLQGLVQGLIYSNIVLFKQWR